MGEMNGKPYEIKKGKVDGDKFSFKVVIENDKGERSSFYQERSRADQLKGLVKYRGVGITRPFQAKRVN